MPQKFLHGAEVGTLVEQVGRKGVAQLVGRHIQRQFCGGEMRFQAFLDLPWLHAAASPGADHRSIVSRFQIEALHEGFQALRSDRPEWAEPHFLPLPEDAGDALARIDLPVVERT